MKKKAGRSPCSQIFLKDLPKRLAKNPNLARDAQGTFEIHLDGPEGGVWTLDFDQDPPEFREGKAAGEPSVRVEMSVQDFLDFFQGKRSGLSLFLLQRIRVSGDMDLARRMGQILTPPAPN